MSDVFTKEKRSQVMAAIKSRGNDETEKRLARILRRYRISGWRRHLPLLGKPDFTFERQRVVVFVDGCFWHGCTSHCRVPKSNRDYWIRKLDRNRTRDRRVTRRLRHEGWGVVRLWQHDLIDESEIVSRIQSALEKRAIKKCELTLRKTE